MTGPKLNEGVLLVDETQVATKATARYLKGSATKARQVLDLIRGLDVRRADEVLQFTDRAAAQDVRKVLASAVANAVHNDNQDADELFVLACFADEGPTLKRFRPRARGRASRIRKRTCHITVIVARMSDSRLEVVQARQEKSAAAGGRRVGTSAQSRRDRVARSRARAESLRGGETVEGADEVTEEAEASESPESTDASQIGDTSDAEADAADLPAGAVVAPEDGSIPSGYEIKGNASSKKFHIPGGRYYDITVAELFFDTVESAESAGYEAPVADADKVEEAHEENN
jgi:large subunit ribosomal protein L22